jgi:NTE family protein
MTVAFVLSGGASLGAIQVGMLRALAERDIRPDVIIGTSVGAVNGAFLAGRELSVETVEELAGIWRGLRRGRVFPTEPLTGFLGFLGARRNLVPAGALRRLIARHVEHERLEDLPIPLHVIACDVLTGSELRLSSGPLLEAIMASAAIPGIFPPVEWDGRLLIDGGVVNNTPITHALDLRPRHVYVLPTGGPCELTTPPRGALGMLIHATNLLVAQRFVGEATTLTGSRVTILPPPCPIRVQPTDFDHADDLIARAHDSAGTFLDDERGRIVALSRAHTRTGHRAQATRRHCRRPADHGRPPKQPPRGCRVARDRVLAAQHPRPGRLHHRARERAGTGCPDRPA